MSLLRNKGQYQVNTRWIQHQFLSISSFEHLSHPSHFPFSIITILIQTPINSGMNSAVSASGLVGYSPHRCQSHKATYSCDCHMESTQETLSWTPTYQINFRLKPNLLICTFSVTSFIRLSFLGISLVDLEGPFPTLNPANSCLFSDVSSAALPLGRLAHSHFQTRSSTLLYCPQPGRSHIPLKVSAD